MRQTLSGAALKDRNGRRSMRADDYRFAGGETERPQFSAKPVAQIASILGRANFHCVVSALRVGLRATKRLCEGHLRLMNSHDAAGFSSRTSSADHCRRNKELLAGGFRGLIAGSRAPAGRTGKAARGGARNRFRVGECFRAGEPCTQIQPRLEGKALSGGLSGGKKSKKAGR